MDQLARHAQGHLNDAILAVQATSSQQDLGGPEDPAADLASMQIARFGSAAYGGYSTMNTIGVLYLASHGMGSYASNIQANAMLDAIALRPPNVPVPSQEHVVQTCSATVPTTGG